MKTGRNLQEVLVELNRQNQAKQDFISPAQGMRLREDGQTFEINHLTTSQQEVFGTTSLFHRQVASALGIPAKYYDLMQTQKPELLAENVNCRQAQLLHGPLDGLWCRTGSPCTVVRTLSSYRQHGDCNSCPAAVCRQ